MQFYYSHYSWRSHFGFRTDTRQECGLHGIQSTNANVVHMAANQQTRMWFTRHPINECECGLHGSQSTNANVVYMAANQQTRMWCTQYPISKGPSIFDGDQAKPIHRDKKNEYCYDFNLDEWQSTTEIHAWMPTMTKPLMSHDHVTWSQSCHMIMSHDHHHVTWSPPQLKMFQ